MRPYKRFPQDFSGETITQQHFKDECDINNVVANYDRTGIDPYADRLSKQTYGDGTYRTYQDALILVAETTSKFNELPLTIREQYNNDVETYLAAVERHENRPEDDIPPLQNEALSEPLIEPPEDSKSGQTEAN